MIGYIAGTLIEKNLPHLLTDCHGVGYEIDVPMSTFYNPPATDEKVILFTQQIMREDAHLLYDFSTITEHETLRRLIKILGIGARVALAVLSGVLVVKLVQAITLQETGRLTRVPGIGKKTVERPLFEPKGKLGADSGMVPGNPAVSGGVVDALNTLLALGYSDKEAVFAIKRVSADMGVFEGTKLAPRTLSKGWHPGVARRQNGLPAPSQRHLSVMIETDKLAARAISAERITSASPTSPNEEVSERALHPKLLDEYAGQEKVRGQLDIFVVVTKDCSEALDRMLLFSLPGLGKTTLVHITAREVGVNPRRTSGPVLECPGDLAALLTNPEANDILFVGEIHRSSPAVEEILYSALEDYQIDIVIGGGPVACSVKLDLQPFTLVGAAMRVGMLVSSLRDRLGIVVWLEFYTPVEPTEIVTCSPGLLNVYIVDEGVSEIAKHSHNTSCTANRLPRHVRDFVEVKADDAITREAADAALAMFDTDAVGLGLMDHKLLEAILHKFNGGLVGIGDLVVATDEEHDVIEDVFEPYLTQQGYLQHTPCGRVVTASAYQHFRLGTPESSPVRDLWDDNQ